MQHQFYSICLIAKKMIARDTMELRFEKPTGFTFTAGQFVQFKVGERSAEVLRNYSISSPPHQNYLEFCAKILPTGVSSRFFEELTMGDEAVISEAQGVFVCQPNNTSVVFIATGTGLAPIISMIENLAMDQSLSTLQLLFGVRSEADLFWVERLEKIKRDHPVFNFTITISRPDAGWLGERGRVSEHVTIVPGASYYVCGSVEMVKDVRALLFKKGVDTKSVHFEIF